MGILSWIIWVGSKSSHKSPHKGEAERSQTHKRRLCKEDAGTGVMATGKECQSKQTLGEVRDRFSPGSLEGAGSCQHLHFDHWDECWMSGLQTARGFISVVSQEACGNRLWQSWEKNKLTCWRQAELLLCAPQPGWCLNTRMYTPTHSLKLPSPFPCVILHMRKDWGVHINS